MGVMLRNLVALYRERSKSANDIESICAVVGADMHLRSCEPHLPPEIQVVRDVRHAHARVSRLEQSVRVPSRLGRRGISNPAEGALELVARQDYSLDYLLMPVSLVPGTSLFHSIDLKPHSLRKKYPCGRSLFSGGLLAP